MLNPSLKCLALAAVAADALTTPHAPRAAARRVTAVKAAPVAAPVAAPFSADAAPSDEGRCVDVAFADGRWRFHALWLRDACRDDAHVVAAAGERILTATPVGPEHEACALKPPRAAACRRDGDEIVVTWSDGAAPAEARFSTRVLREYAPTVAKPLDAAAEAAAPAPGDPLWLAPYTGYPDAEGAFGRHAPFLGQGAPFHTVPYEEIEASAATKLEFVERVLLDGAALVTGAPDEDSGVVYRRFSEEVLGGLQKEPTRDEPNWRIVRRADAASISYDPSKRLYQHTDSSIPPHGIPALVLGMHYVDGTGCNTLTDGYAVAAKLREEDPEAFELLAKYGYDGRRDFAGSRGDSVQDHVAGLVIDRKHPVFELDANGELMRIQYNEVFRLPSTLPFDVFPKWYAAFGRFVELVHSPEYEREVPMEKGNILIMNNWRVLHGRAGGRASGDRHVVGGTVLREAIYSRARSLLDEVAAN